MAREAEMPEAGVAAEVTPGIRRVIAPNPGPMTHKGTNSYVIGTSEVAVVDPGPEDGGHRAALLRAVAGVRVAAVLVTHAHLDHSAGARSFAREVGAPVVGFGGPEAGRSAVMARFAAAGGIGGGEGVDHAFAPDEALGDGAAVTVGGAAITALHTPGHFGGHLAFAMGDVVLTGDLVMDWATTLISPPDGDIRNFLASCALLRARRDRLFLPGHGPTVRDPAARLDWLVKHRHDRERGIFAMLERGPATADDIARAVYRDLAPGLLPAAARNVLAHLLDLEDRGAARARPAPSADAVWALT